MAPPPRTRRRSSLDRGDLVRRLKWLMGGRLGIILLSVAFLVFVEGRGTSALRLSHPSYAVLVLACLLNLAYLLLVWARVGLAWMAGAQLVLDVVVISLLVYLTGIDRVFAYLYFSTVIASAVVIEPRASFGIASLATTMLSAVTLLHFYATAGTDLPLLSAETLTAIRRGFVSDLPFQLSFLFSFAASLHLVAFLSGWLVREVRGLRTLHEEILESIQGGVIALDADGRVTFANRRACALLDVPAPSAVRGRHAAEAFPPPVGRIVREALEQSADRIQELLVADRRLEVAASPLRDEKRRTTRGAIVVIHDVTVREQLERVRHLAERFQALAEVSASLAHEIRNPLASIRGAAQELTSLPAADENDRALLAVLVREADRLDRTISDFLDFAADRPVNLEPVDLEALARDVRLLLSTREGPAREGRVRIDADFEHGLVARADADRLKQVLLNLGLNALHAISGGGTVTFRGRRVYGEPGPDGRDAPGVEISVRDTGPGIPEEHLKRIFDPFFTTKEGGTGMGLAIAQRIVRAHGGEIRLESRPGQGATFTVWLPG